MLKEEKRKKELWTEMKGDVKKSSRLLRKEK